MAWRKLPHLQYWPQIHLFSFYINSLPATVQNLDADGEFAGAQIRAPRSGTIEAVHILFRDTNQWPANGIRVHLTPVDLGTNGSPPVIGSDYAFFDYLTGPPPGLGVNTGSIYERMGPITSDGTSTGARKTVTQGEYFGITCSFLGFQASDSFTLGGWTGGNGWNLAKMHNISYYFNGTNWALGPSGNAWGVVLEYTDGVSVPVSIMTMQRGNVEGVAVGAERASKLTPNIPIRCVGIFFNNSTNAVDGKKVHLYSADGGPPLASCTWSTPNRHAHHNLGTWLPFDGNGSVVLQAGKSYRFAMPNGWGPMRFEYQSQFYRDLDLVGDTSFEIMSSARADENDDNAWIDEPLNVESIFPVIDAIDPMKGRASISFAGVRNVVKHLLGNK